MLDPDISTADALRLLTVPDHDPLRMGRRKFLQLVGMGVGAGALAGPLGSLGQGWAAPVGPTDGIVVLLGPDELEACHGSTDALVAAVHAAVDAKGLRWPTR